MSGFFGGGGAASPIKAYARITSAGLIDATYASSGVSGVTIVLGRYVIDITAAHLTLLPQVQIQVMAPGGAPWPYFTNTFAVAVNSVTVEINDNSSGPIPLPFAFWVI